MAKSDTTLYCIKRKEDDLIISTIALSEEDTIRKYQGRGLIWEAAQADGYKVVRIRICEVTS